VEGDSLLKVDSLKSRPYIDLTLDVMNRFGVMVENKEYREFHIPGRQRYHAAEYEVEGDWSGAAFIAVTGALSSPVTIGKLQPDSSQADRSILEVLRLAGASVSPGKDNVTVSPGKLKPFSYDINDCPDLAPPLVALAAFCPGRSVITGAKRLKTKESDRAHALQKEFSILGVGVSNLDDRVEIIGTERVKGGDVSSHGDHRIAMALAVAAIRSENPVVVHDAEAVNKSYPGFYDDLRKLGLICEIMKD
jgi:3-phosphoshikimate 1-carboxyvinyltransferase